jgi:hypothetical protein
MKGIFDALEVLVDASHSRSLVSASASDRGE